MYGVRLARQERFVDVARALEHNAVSRDLVAVLQLQHVVQDDFVDVHLPDAAAAYRLYLGSGNDGKPVDRTLCPHLLKMPMAMLQSTTPIKSIFL